MLNVFFPAKKNMSRYDKKEKIEKYQNFIIIVNAAIFFGIVAFFLYISASQRKQYRLRYLKNFMSFSNYRKLMKTMRSLKIVVLELLMNS